MIVRYFNQTKPINLILLSLVLSIFIILSFYLNSNLIFSLENIGVLLILLLNYLLFNYISKNRLTAVDKDYHILFYVLLSSLFILNFNNIQILFAQMLLLFAINEIYKLNSKEINPKKSLFNIGVLIGVSACFFALSSLFLFIVFLAVIIFNHIQWRSFIIPIIGFLVPFILLFLLKDLFGISWLNNIQVEFGFSTPTLFNKFSLKIISGILLLLLTVALVKVSTNLNTELIFYKDYHILIIIQLLIAISMLFLTKENNSTSLSFLIYPISVIFANAIPFVKKKWLANILIFVLLALIVFIYL